MRLGSHVVISIYMFFVNSGLDSFFKACVGLNTMTLDALDLLVTQNGPLIVNEVQVMVSDKITESFGNFAGKFVYGYITVYLVGLSQMITDRLRSVFEGNITKVNRRHGRLLATNNTSRHEYHDKYPILNTTSAPDNT